MAYWAHLTKLTKHVVNQVPPCAYISQELQRFKFNNLRQPPLFEPPFLVALLDNLIELISMLT